MTSVSILRLGLIALAGLLAVVSARAEDAPTSCEVPDYLLATESKLPKVAEAIRSGHQLNILVLGSRSSTINAADGTWTIEAEGKVVARGTSIIDPTKKPKTVDLTITEGQDKGKTALGIYEFSDGTRKVCLAPAGKERPTEFAAPTGSDHILAVLKRVKK